MSRVLGHFGPWLLATLVGVLAVVTVVPAASSFVAWQALLMLQASVVFLAFAIFTHNRHLCARCIAAIPLDATRVAARYGRRFRVAHLFERRWYAIGYLSIVVTFAFLATHPIGKYVWIVVEASLVYLLIVYVTHQRLQPWCPQCQHGGEEVAAPTTPTPVASNP
jgi:hypothetical protein